jgi:hypothetical protein
MALVGWIFVALYRIPYTFAFGMVGGGARVRESWSWPECWLGRPGLVARRPTIAGPGPGRGGGV